MVPAIVIFCTRTEASMLITAGQAVNGVREYYMVDCIGSEILTEEGENHEVGGVAPEVDDDGFGILQYIHDASALLIGELCGVDVSYPVVDEHTALFGNGIFGKIDEFSCVAVCTGRYPYTVSYTHLTLPTN